MAECTSKLVAPSIAALPRSKRTYPAHQQRRVEHHLGKSVCGKGRVACVITYRWWWWYFYFKIVSSLHTSSPDLWRDMNEKARVY